MHETERVAEVLETCMVKGGTLCSTCMYRGNRTFTECRRSVCADAAQLLRGRAPVEPEETDVWDELHCQWVYSLVCGACQTVLDRADRYCRQCGRKVKRDDIG